MAAPVPSDLTWTTINSHFASGDSRGFNLDVINVVPTGSYYYSTNAVYLRSGTSQSTVFAECSLQGQDTIANNVARQSGGPVTFDTYVQECHAVTAATYQLGCQANPTACID